MCNEATLCKRAWSLICKEYKRDYLNCNGVFLSWILAVDRKLGQEVKRPDQWGSAFHVVWTKQTVRMDTTAVVVQAKLFHNTLHTIYHSLKSWSARLSRLYHLVMVHLVSRILTFKHIYRRPSIRMENTRSEAFDLYLDIKRELAMKCLLAGLKKKALKQE